jgi:hypothetical protein
MLPRLDAHELMRLGAVVEHFHHHVEEHGEKQLSFMEFLVDHFSANSTPDPEHDSLPLHHHSECTGITACQVASDGLVFVAVPTMQEATEPPAMISFCQPQAVFQPPRV